MIVRELSNGYKIQIAIRETAAVPREDVNFTFIIMEYNDENGKRIPHKFGIMSTKPWFAQSSLSPEMPEVNLMMLKPVIHDGEKIISEEIPDGIGKEEMEKICREMIDEWLEKNEF